MSKNHLLDLIKIDISSFRNKLFCGKEWNEQGEKSIVIGYVHQSICTIRTNLTIIFKNKKTIQLSGGIMWLKISRLDAQQDLSIFVQYPELRDVHMGFNDFEVANSEPSLPKPTVIPYDDASTLEEGGMKSNQDASQLGNEIPIVENDNISENVNNQDATNMAWEPEKGLEQQAIKDMFLNKANMLEKKICKKYSLARTDLLTTDRQGQASAAIGQHHMSMLWWCDPNELPQACSFY